MKSFFKKILYLDKIIFNKLNKKEKALLIYIVLGGIFILEIVYIFLSENCAEVRSGNNVNNINKSLILIRVIFFSKNI